ncbi:MAG: hypothetical protein KGN84_00880 [Acidobacteriota bacterium]|nr:hypothetical protein [Acidobacteriota bacterium]
MSNDAYALLIDVACFAAWLMVIAPALIFLQTAWADRRNALFDIMTDATLALYYNRFSPSRKIDPALRVQTFRRDFGRAYGRRRYVIPLLIVAALAGWGLYGTAGTIKVWVHVAQPGEMYAIDEVALGALLGGLTWVISDNLARFRTRDFTSHDVYNGAFRLLVAVPLGYSLGSFLDVKFKVAMAFLLGVFPTSTIFTIARRLGSKQFGLGGDSPDGIGQSELEKLQSVSQGAAERFRDEGVSSIAGLAWTDPIDLTIRTNFDFTFVVDCISQALLWIYVRDDIQQLYVLSLRGAQEVAYFTENLKSPDPEVKAGAGKTLEEAAARLKIGKEAFLQTLDQVVEDPSTKFLVGIWADQN